MKKSDVIFRTYVFLHENGLVSSESEFSQDWLGKGECYMRTLRFKNAEPSLGSVAICASRLNRAGHEMIRMPRLRRTGIEMVKLGDALHDQVNEQAVQFEIAS